MQRLKLLRTDAQFAEHGSVIGTQRGRCAAWAGVTTRQAETAAQDRQGPINAGRIRNVFDQLAPGYLRMLENFRNGHDPARWNAVAVQQFLPIGRTASRESPLQFDGQGFAVPLARLPVGEAAVTGKLLSTDQPAQCDVLFLLVGGDIERPVRLS